MLGRKARIGSYRDWMMATATIRTAGKKRKSTGAVSAKATTTAAAKPKPVSKAKVTTKAKPRRILG